MQSADQRSGVGKNARNSWVCVEECIKEGWVRLAEGAFEVHCGGLLDGVVYRGGAESQKRRNHLRGTTQRCETTFPRMPRLSMHTKGTLNDMTQLCIVF